MSVASGPNVAVAETGENLAEGPQGLQGPAGVAGVAGTRGPQGPLSSQGAPSASGLFYSIVDVAIGYGTNLGPIKVVTRTNAQGPAAPGGVGFAVTQSGHSCTGARYYWGDTHVVRVDLWDASGANVASRIAQGPAGVGSVSFFSPAALLAGERYAITIWDLGSSYTTVWTAGQQVCVGLFMLASPDTGFYYEVTNAGLGTTGGVQPVWPLTIGQSSSPDANGVIWKCIGVSGSATPSTYNYWKYGDGSSGLQNMVSVVPSPTGAPRSVAWGPFIMGANYLVSVSTPLNTIYGLGAGSGGFPYTTGAPTSDSGEFLPIEPEVS